MNNLVGSSLLFLLLPDVQNPDNDTDFSIKAEAGKVISIIKDGKYKFLLIYFFFPGLCVGFYATFLFKLVKLSVETNSGDE